MEAEDIRQLVEKLKNLSNKLHVYGVERLVTALLAGAPGAQRRARELVHRADDSAVEQAVVDYTADLIAELRTGAEGQEGLSAFLEKRPAAWRHE